MINAMQPDLGMLKQASQIRELCELQEAKLRKMKNLWAGIFLFSMFVFLIMKALLPGMAAYVRNFDMQFFTNPVIKLIIAGMVVMALAITIYCFANFASARSKTEKARKDEWRLVMYLNRELTRR